MKTNGASAFSSPPIRHQKSTGKERVAPGAGNMEGGELVEYRQSIPLKEVGRAALIIKQFIINVKKMAQIAKLEM